MKIPIFPMTRLLMASVLPKTMATLMCLRDISAYVACQFGHLILGLAIETTDLIRVPIKNLPGFCQGDLVPLTERQLRFEHFLQITNLMSHRRLGDIKRLCRLGKAAGSGHCQKNPQIIIDYRLYLLGTKDGRFEVSIWTLSPFTVTILHSPKSNISQGVSRDKRIQSEPI